MNIKSKFITGILLILSAGLFGCSSDEKDDNEISHPYMPINIEPIKGPDACLTAKIVSHGDNSIWVKLISASDSSVWEEYKSSGMAQRRYYVYAPQWEGLTYNDGDIISFRMKQYCIIDDIVCPTEVELCE